MDAPVLEVSASHQDPRPLGATVAGRYQLRRILGRGGAAVVFAADHVIVHRPVAIKLPLRNPEIRELLDARLRCETQALAHVRHPAIVDIIDAGEDDGMPYLAMELLEGRTLSGLLSARGRLEPDEVIKVGAALAEGLATAHSAGVIHRDVKPANVLITREARNQIHLCDFGIARLLGPEVRQERALTQLGAILGTPEYMPLEAFVSGPEVDHRVDVFSLGMMLYECLMGALPVEGAVGAILRQRTKSTAPQLHELRPDVSRQLSQVIARCLAQEPGDRFAQMSELASALRACTTKQVDDIDLLRSAAANPAITVAAHKPDGAAMAARRAYARAPYVTLASLQRGASAAQDARIEDLSEGGALLVTREACKPSELVKLRFGMPISGRVYALNATVRWSRAGRGSPATGVEFNNLPDAAREEIRKYVALMSNARTGADKT